MLSVLALAKVDGDHQLLGLWLHGRSEHTERAHSAEVDSFLAFAMSRRRGVAKAIAT
jgi:hypothetical protein